MALRRSFSPESSTCVSTVSTNVSSSFKCEANSFASTGSPSRASSIRACTSSSLTGDLPVEFERLFEAGALLEGLAGSFLIGPEAGIADQCLQFVELTLPGPASKKPPDVLASCLDLAELLNQFVVHVLLLSLNNHTLVSLGFQVRHTKVTSDSLYGPTITRWHLRFSV